MYRFPVKVERRGESFVVIVPTVPGCVTSGRSREEALRRVREMLQAILMQAGPSFSLAVGAFPLPGEGVDGEYVEVAAASVPPC